MNLPIIPPPESTTLPWERQLTARLEAEQKLADALAELAHLRGETEA